MAVLKQTSPTRVPVAPKDSPSKYRPTSRARSVRTSLRIIELIGRFSIAIRGIVLSNPQCGGQKNPDRIFDPGFKFYPAGAVQVNSPVPFSERVDDRCCGI